MCNWQRVEVGLPEVSPTWSDLSIDVVVLTNYKSWYKAYYEYSGNRWFDSETNSPLNGITHWTTVELPGE